LPDTLKAPIEQGKSYGHINISLSGDLIAQRALVALQSAAATNSGWGGVGNYIGHSVGGLFKGKNKPKANNEAKASQ